MITNNMMDTDFNHVYPLIPQKVAERINVIIGNAQPDEKLVCLAYYTNDISEYVENLVDTFRDCQQTAKRIFLPCKEIEFSKATKFLLIVDALNPIVQSVSVLLDYIASLPSLKNNLAILLVNTASIPSPTEAKRNVRVVLEVKGLKASVFTEEETEMAVKVVASMSVNVQELRMEFLEQAKNIAVLALNETLQDAIADKNKQQESKTAFLKRQESMCVYAKQLKLDTWIMIQNYCDKQLEADVRSFAKKMMPELERMIHDVDLQRMHYYFAPYLNYLWGQFLTNEVALMMEQLKEEISTKIEELLSTYRNYFCEEAKLGELDPVLVRAGAQPISFDVEHYNYTLNKLFDWIVGGLIRYKFLVYGDILTGGRIGQIVTNILNNLLNPVLRIKYSNQKILKMYSEVIYKQFFENIDDMVVQLRDYMVPTLEKNFKESIQEVIDSLESNMETFGHRLDQRIEGANSHLYRIQQTIDSLR